MYRAAVLDSPGWTVFFVLQSLAAKYLIENLFLTIYISIYSRLILHHATKQAAIILDFEKSAHQKREMVEKSIFRGASDRRKQLFRERQQAEIEARSSLLKEMKGLRIMRGTEGRRLFTNALNSVLKTSKRKQRSDSVTPPTISIAGFSYRDPDTPNRRISSLAPRRRYQRKPQVQRKRRRKPQRRRQARQPSPRRDVPNNSFKPTPRRGAASFMR